MRIIILFILLIPSLLLAQTQGPLNPSSNGIDAGIGTIDWNNGSDAYTSNNVRAYTNTMINGDKSYYLTETNFGFAIPSTATIDGIVVEVERRDNGSGNIMDNSIKIIQGGSIIGSQHSAGGNWPSSDTYKTYGNATDLWGTTWLYSDINASNFGIAISCKKAGAGNNQGEIDHVRITIYYTDNPLPIELLSFTGKQEDECNVLEWITATEFNNDYFTIERSPDATNFNVVGTINGAGNSTNVLFYYMEDTKPFEGITYYRLSQYDFNGNSKEFTVIVVAHINTGKLKVIKITNLLGQDVPDNTEGIKIYYFNDGSYVKKIKLLNK